MVMCLAQGHKGERSFSDMACKLAELSSGVVPLMTAQQFPGQ